MPLHRKIDLTGGFVADYDWATNNENPEASGANQITGLVEPIVVPRPGVEVLVACTFYDGAGSNASSVAAGTAKYKCELVYEGGNSERQYKARPTLTTDTEVKFAALEQSLPVNRKAWVRLTALDPLPVGATHVWITYELVERRGT